MPDSHNKHLFFEKATVSGCKHFLYAMSLQYKNIRYQFTFFRGGRERGEVKGGWEGVVKLNFSTQTVYIDSYFYAIGTFALPKARKKALDFLPPPPLSVLFLIRIIYILTNPYHHPDRASNLIPVKSLE